MSTITLILEPSPDGSLHLPLPEELRGGRVKIVATMTAADEASNVEPQVPKGFGGLKGKIWMTSDFDEPLDDFREYME